jgi:alcohol dehydrogenase class IV
MSYPHTVHTEEWDVISAARVITGLGSIKRLGGLLADRGARHVLIVTDPGVAAAGITDRIAAGIGLPVTVHSAIPANPSTAALDVAVAVARESGADHLVAVGGGSALDAAKAIALTTPLPGSEVLPLVAVPTTAGTGAETNGFGVLESADHRKVYLGDERTAPWLVVLDAELTIGLPPKVTAACGFDAVVHGAESILSRGATAVSRAYAAESLRLTVGALPHAVEDGADVEARSRMLLGAHLAGRALTLSGLGLVHGIAHSVTATIGTPHGVALASIAGPALRFGLGSAPASYAELARAMDVSAGAAAVDRIADLAEDVGLPTSAAEVGVTGGLVTTIVAKTLADPVTNNTPRRPTETELAELLT